MRSVGKFKGAGRARCSCCGNLFDLVVPFGEFPGGLKVEGKPCCWDCAESVMREFENKPRLLTVEKSK